MGILYRPESRRNLEIAKQESNRETGLQQDRKLNEKGQVKKLEFIIRRMGDPLRSFRHINGQDE